LSGSRRMKVRLVPLLWIVCVPRASAGAEPHPAVAADGPASAGMGGVAGVAVAAVPDDAGHGQHERYGDRSRAERGSTRSGFHHDDLRAVCWLFVTRVRRSDARVRTLLLALTSGWWAAVYRRGPAPYGRRGEPATHGLLSMRVDRVKRFRQCFAKVASFPADRLTQEPSRHRRLNAPARYMPCGAKCCR
jgi:hypothetical protein